MSTTATSWLEVDMVGLRRTLERKGKAWAVFELVSLFSVDEASISNFPACLGSIERVSAAVGFEVKAGGLLVDIAKQMPSNAVA